MHFNAHLGAPDGRSAAAATLTDTGIESSPSHSDDVAVPLSISGQSFQRRRLAPAARQPKPAAQLAPVRGEVGLSNHHLMCYMNSCIAVVLRIPAFTFSLSEVAQPAALEGDDSADGGWATMEGMPVAAVTVAPLTVTSELLVMVPAFQIGNPGADTRPAVDNSLLALVSMVTHW